MWLCIAQMVVVMEVSWKLFLTAAEVAVLPVTCFDSQIDQADFPYFKSALHAVHLGLKRQKTLDWRMMAESAAVLDPSNDTKNPLKLENVALPLPSVRIHCR